MQSKPRDQPLVESLYSDAERRNVELKSKQEEFDRTRGMSKEIKFVNKNMDQFVASKFERDFQAAI